MNTAKLTLNVRILIHDQDIPHWRINLLWRIARWLRIPIDVTPSTP